MLYRRLKHKQRPGSRLDNQRIAKRLILALTCVPSLSYDATAMYTQAAMRFLITVYVAIQLALTVGCGESMRPIDSEAFEEGRKYWDAILMKCGDSSFAVYAKTGEIVEFKGASGFGLSDRDGKRDWEPSDADKLNGLEWKGACHFMPYKPFRIYQNGKWSDWYDEIRDRRFVLDNIPMRKFKGQWEINNGQPAPFKTIACDQLPAH
jgi:hypothetical protein